MVNSFSEEIFLITGASSGLGFSLSLEAARKNARIIMIARNSKRLYDCAEKINEVGGKAFPFSFDLKNIYDIQPFFEEIVSTTGVSPSILINNAGYNAAGFIQNTPLPVVEENYRVNTLAPLALIQSVLPSMIDRRHGSIVNIMSTAMYQSFPGISSYYASKCALRAFHESLFVELSGLGIHTLYVEPPAFKSRYWINMDKGDRLGNFSHPPHSNDPEPVCLAGKILSAIQGGKKRVVFGGIKDKIGYHLKYWAPGLLNRLIVSRNENLLNNRPIKKKLPFKKNENPSTQSS